MSVAPDIEVWVLGDPRGMDDPFWAAVFAEDLDALEQAFDRPIGFLQQSGGGFVVGERHLEAERMVNELYQQGRLVHATASDNPKQLVRVGWRPPAPKSGSAPTWIW